MVNSLAKACGYEEDAYPYPTLSTPPEFAATHIDFGFDLKKDVTILPTNQHVAQVMDAGNSTNNAGDQDNDDVEDDVDLELEAEEDTEPEVNPPGVADMALLPEIEIMILPNETTMEAFKRLTSKQDWCPFWKNGPKSTLQIEELNLFERMYSDYDYGKPPRCPSGKGYKSFETAWNLEVADRYKRFADGEPVQLIKRKTVDLLKQQYERMQEQLGTAARADEATRQMVSMDQRFNRLIRDNRNHLPVLPPPTNAVPVQYQHQLGVMPFGNPMALNANIAAPNFRINPQRGTAPYILMTDPVVGVANADPARGFRKLKYCIKCGWSKKHHNRHRPKLKFGHDCSYNVCGKCYQLSRFHPKKGKYDMGIYCKSTITNQLCTSNVLGWYTTQNT